MPFESVYLARHSQTEWNTTGRRQGRLDSPLTQLGLRQAHQNAALLRPHPIDAIFTSPLPRARRTAEILATAIGLPVHRLEDLAEVDHGEWSGLTSAEIDTAWPGRRAERDQTKYTFTFPGGESYAAADLRAERALKLVAHAGSRHPLLVSHEMIGRMLAKQLVGLTPAEALARHQPSDVVYVVRPDGTINVLKSPE
ncbi:histidine phosphatase family protein [Kribbella lupini]|uniref:Histidine phosphatase family protein n=1 Tax=Kribbella lupini TaxID=291602 RepID=A0ABN2C7I1_9ACTN